MTGFLRLPWTALAISALGLGACGGGGGDDAPQNVDSIPVALQQVFTGLPAFSQPIAMLQAPGDASRWFVVEQGGVVRVFNNTPAVATTSVFLNISGRIVLGNETGLLGMAFHPNFPTDPRVYVYSAQNDVNLGLVTRISEFRTADAGATLDPNSERIILTVDQPETNHKGGGIAFGPGGFLFAGLGDGGGGDDQHPPIGNGQRMTTLLGKMLRIDIGGPASVPPYTIPSGNPGAGNALCGANGTGAQNCPEIYASGFRNPWRWSFDRQTGELWVGDVGQGALEEVDRVTIGGNYGWRCFEGTRNTGLGCGMLSNPMFPVAEYGRSVGATVIGGYVYRGTAFPALVGRYVFGDFITGRIFNIPSATQPTVTVSGGLSSGLSIASFAQDNDGELYVVDYGGDLYQIRP